MLSEETSEDAFSCGLFMKHTWRSFMTTSQAVIESEVELPLPSPFRCFTCNSPACYVWPNPLLTIRPNAYCPICLTKAKTRLAVALGLTQR